MEANEDMYGELVISISGKTLTQAEREVISHPLVGGILLLQRNIENGMQLHHLVNQLQKAKRNILIFVDNEGYDLETRKGIWRMMDQRSKKPIIGFEPPPNQYYIGQEYLKSNAVGRRLSYDSGKLISHELAPYHIVSFATCSDMNPFNRKPGSYHSDHLGEVIWYQGRSFGHNQKMVRDLIHSKLNGIEGVRVLKHFPDHGSSFDSHSTIAKDHRPLRYIMEHVETVIQPNISLIDVMMLSHVIFTNSPEPQTPVSLSVWWHGYLQKILNEDTLIISDDLAMGAIKKTGFSPTEIISLCSNPFAFNNKHHLDFKTYNNHTNIVTHLLITTMNIETLKKILPKLTNKVSDDTKKKINRLTDKMNSLRSNSPL